MANVQHLHGRTYRVCLTPEEAKQLFAVAEEYNQSGADMLAWIVQEEIKDRFDAIA